TLRVAQPLASAGRTLRTCRYIMFHDGRAQEIQADDVIAQVRSELGGDCPHDLDGGKLDGALSHQILGKSRNDNAARARAVEKSLDLPVAHHAVGQAGPTGALARA